MKLGYSDQFNQLQNGKPNDITNHVEKYQFIIVQICDNLHFGIETECKFSQT
ncbi:MAG: hypothetical protein K0S01_2300 [Herbinix sp.]|jgi:hypothetical protein|nr:hypothetical protein [Herbinix sp.]